MGWGQIPSLTLRAFMGCAHTGPGLIDRGSYVVGEHASERLLERGIMESEG
jgi:hypothetical protein